jgi:hypothetical protein
MQLAQYTTFWHHPNGLCIADAGWTKTPPPDLAPSTATATPAAGSGDPKGSFVTGEYGETSGVGGGTSSVLTYNGIEVIVTRTISDTGVTQTMTRRDNGQVINTSVSPWGLVGASDRQNSTRPRTGRLGWQEVIR